MDNNEFEKALKGLCVDRVKPVPYEMPGFGPVELVEPTALSVTVAYESMSEGLRAMLGRQGYRNAVLAAMVRDGEGGQKFTVEQLSRLPERMFGDLLDFATEHFPAAFGMEKNA